MSKNNRIYWTILAIMVFSFIVPQSVSAVAKEELVKTAGFTYTINHPDNQIAKEKRGALNLKMTAGQKQTVTVLFNNSSETELILDLTLNGARTNSNGGIEYGPSKFKKDKSMKYDLPDLVTIPETLVIPPKGQKELEIDINMPKVAMDGIVTGGIQVQEHSEEVETSKETMIVNKIAYLFGLTLQMTDTKLKPELTLEKIYPGQTNYRNAVFIDVVNKQAMRLSGLLMDVQITKKGKSDILYESKSNNMEMAPNTIMSYPVSLGGEKMVAGMYTAHIVASSQAEEYKWEKDFEITNNEANQFNQQDVSIVQERGLDWKKVAIIVSIVLIIIVVIYVVIRVVQRTKKNSKSLSNHKRKK